MSNGKEEEYVLNPEYLKPTLSNFEANFKTIIEDANNNSSNEYDSVNSVGNVSSRIRKIDNPIIVPTIKKDEPRENNNYFYQEVPTYTINQNQTGVGGSKAAFAAVLIVTEILALIVLVTLVTFVAFYGLS